MSLRKILVFPAPALRKLAEPVSKIDEDLKVLVSDMIETMHAAPGVGLAAPQIGVNLRLIVADPTAGENPELVLELINPEIVSAQGSVEHGEGCLSLPDVEVKIKRSEQIVVKARRLNGQIQTFEVEGYLSYIFQHEIDHLNGILIIDSLGPVKRDLVKRKLRKRQRVEA
jgi:peptide deformylase